MNKSAGCTQALHLLTKLLSQKNSRTETFTVSCDEWRGSAASTSPSSTQTPVSFVFQASDPASRTDIGFLSLPKGTNRPKSCSTRSCPSVWHPEHDAAASVNTVCHSAPQVVCVSHTGKLPGKKTFTNSRIKNIPNKMYVSGRLCRGKRFILVVFL